MLFIFNKISCPVYYCSQNSNSLMKKKKTTLKKDRKFYSFFLGFKREVVVRGTWDEDKTKKPPADVYYHPPKGKKLVSPGSKL